MKKKLLAFIMALSLSLGAVPAYAHSGRTDAAGGHHDYNNVSGLGSYHYHHGYPAHLHPSGVCPYETTSATATVPKTNTSYTSTTQSNTTPATVTKPVAQSKTTSQNQINAVKNTMTVYVNGQRINADNYIIDDTTFLPIRSIADALGATIDFDAITKTATIRVPQQTSVITETVTQKDVAMSNYLIASIYAANMSRTMFFIEANVNYLSTDNSSDNRNLLGANIDSLRGLIDDVYNFKLDMLYPLAEDATFLANNAENCLSLAEDNLIPSPAYNNYYKFVIDYLYDGLEEADLVYGNGYNYAINK